MGRHLVRDRLADLPARKGAFRRVAGRRPDAPCRGCDGLSVCACGVAVRDLRRAVASVAWMHRPVQPYRHEVGFVIECAYGDSLCQYRPLVDVAGMNWDRYAFWVGPWRRVAVARGRADLVTCGRGEAR